MKAIKDYLLVTQTFTKKKESKIITLGDKPTEDTYDITLEVKQLGKGLTDVEVEVGDKILLNTYANPIRVNKISGKPGDQTVINEVLYHYDDVVGLE